MTESERQQIKEQAEERVRRSLPPAPTLRLSKRQQHLWDLLLEGIEVAEAFAISKCSKAEGVRLFEVIQRYDELCAMRRISALRELGTMVAMWGPLRGICEAGGQMYPDDPELSASLILWIREAARPTERTAVGLLLDYFEPGWRELLTSGELGPLVTRDSPEVRAWKKAVLKRDGRSCQACGAKRKLHVHHIVGWAQSPEMRVEVVNGMTLCNECHANRHPEIAGLVRHAGG